MGLTDDYKSLITEIVKKQMDILGPEIAISRARLIRGLKLKPDGDVADISEDPQVVLQELVSSYMALSGEILKNIMGPVFAKYPAIKIDIK